MTPARMRNENGNGGARRLVRRPCARQRDGLVGPLAAVPLRSPQRDGPRDWPSRKEVYATTFVVILTSVFFGVYLWGVDLLLNSGISWIYRTFGAAS